MNMMNKTVRSQFTSYALFHITPDQIDEIRSFGIPKSVISMLLNANQGVAYLSFVGAKRPLFPVAVAAPVSAYKQSNTDFFAYAREMGAQFTSGDIKDS
jgi:hypothetical protein